jgi:predicted esterase
MSRTDSPIISRKIKGATDIPLHFHGPALESGPLPALFYFALAADESLEIDPYNQPVQFLHRHPIRVFSMTLPGHGPGFDKTVGVEYWLQQLLEGNDVISPFLDAVKTEIEHLVAKGWIDKRHIAVAGLSRGAFIALHAAARTELVTAVLGYSPLIEATYYRQHFAGKSALIESLALSHLYPQLIGKKIRLYIGNRDVLVGTENAFRFVSDLTELSYTHKVRTPPVELIIFPSIGHKGHGTPPSIFKEGSDWIQTTLTGPPS